MSAPALYSHASPGWYNNGIPPKVDIHSSVDRKCCGLRPSLCTPCANNGWEAGRDMSVGNPCPDRNVSRSRTVIGREAGTTSSTGLDGVRTTHGEASSGSQVETGES